MSRQIGDDAHAIAFFQRIIASQDAILSTISIIKSYLTMHKLEILLTTNIKSE
ncbi:MAG: hypothetical protein V7K56_29775 [Nostoc sp.]